MVGQRDNGIDCMIKRKVKARRRGDPELIVGCVGTSTTS